jgi:hypothetical protein
LLEKFGILSKVTTQKWSLIELKCQLHVSWLSSGMMNNAVYRMKVRHVEVDGKAALHFQHPTVGGTTPGGWMNIDESTTPHIEVYPSQNMFNVHATSAICLSTLPSLQASSSLNFAPKEKKKILF